MLTRNACPTPSVPIQKRRRLRVSWPRARGFTLIELIMVMVIVAILGSIAQSRFTAFYGFKVDGAAQQLGADIRYTQQLSIDRHVAHGIEFDTTNNRYRVFEVSTDINVRDPLTRVAGASGQPWTSGYVVDYGSDPEYLGISLDSAVFGTTVQLRFTSLGRPQDGTDTNLAANGAVQLSLQGFVRNLEVTPTTGRVTYP